MIKYTINFDGMFASFGNVYSEEKYANESLALPENVLNHFKKEKHHSSVYLFDRGLISGSKLNQLCEQQGLLFVGRLLENRKLDIIEKRDCQNMEFKYGELLQDDLAHIYGSRERFNRNSNLVREQVLQPEQFRVIRFKSAETGKEILLITNVLVLREDGVFDFSANKIAELYKFRWDTVSELCRTIETFFRFLKQELNFSHFLSLNENGIQVVLYMSLITAMLVLLMR